MKEWYIQVDGYRQGPYSIQDLRTHPKVNPDVFVWKEGMLNWRRMRDVPELADVFKDKKKPNGDEEEDELDSFFKKKGEKWDQQNEVLTLSYPPPHLLMWLFIVIMILLYVIYSMS